MSRSSSGPTRRQIVSSAGAVLFAAGCSGASRRDSAAAPKHGEHEEEVSPNEDLMREHGVLRRVLLVYEEAAGRLDAGQDVPPEVLVDGAGIVRRFVEDYHEKLEEDFVFPRLERARREVELVATLRAQHAAGRTVTETIARLAKAGGPSQELTAALRAFSRMYRPHAAREDTVLFPAFREVVSEHEYEELGEQFEDKEHALFGAHGFTTMVEAVATLERALGIHELARFTP